MPQRCDQCHGRGKYPCPFCGGSGHNIIPPEESEDGEVHIEDCENEECGAGSLDDGMVWCDNCGGDGEVRDKVLLK